MQTKTYASSDQREWDVVVMVCGDAKLEHIN
jgi:hypothetical protein